jgi:archaemetzincin
MRFEPPSDAERRHAVGDLTTMPPALRRAFEPDDDFEAIPAPGRGDWLSIKREPRQSFERYTHTTTNRPDAIRHTIYLQPLDDYPSDAEVSVEELRRFAAAFFQLRVEIQPALPVASEAITVRRNRFTGVSQLLTRDVLRILAARVPQDACAVLGVTLHDLYPHPSWSFVFGEALLDDRVGVFSFMRYHPRFYDRSESDARELLLRRCAKVLAHETGHMFGLRHCTYFSCLMNGSNHLRESDRRPLHLCPVDLRKLHWAIGFDLVERYRQLRSFWRDAGLLDEVAWMDGRLAKLVSGDPASMREAVRQPD